MYQVVGAQLFSSGTVFSMFHLKTKPVLPMGTATLFLSISPFTKDCCVIKRSVISVNVSSFILRKSV